jgi:hypothetical protein
MAEKIMCSEEKSHAKMQSTRPQRHFLLPWLDTITDENAIEHSGLSGLFDFSASNRHAAALQNDCKNFIVGWIEPEI